MNLRDLNPDRLPRNAARPRRNGHLLGALESSKRKWARQWVRVSVLAANIERQVAAERAVGKPKGKKGAKKLKHRHG